MDRWHRKGWGGTGLVSMLLMASVTVFIAGRWPHFGKKIEAREIKLVMLSFEGVRGFPNPQIAPMTAEYLASLGASHPTGLPTF